MNLLIKLPMVLVIGFTMAACQNSKYGQVKGATPTAKLDDGTKAPGTPGRKDGPDWDRREQFSPSPEKKDEGKKETFTPSEKQDDKTERRDDSNVTFTPAAPKKPSADTTSGSRESGAPVTTWTDKNARQHGSPLDRCQGTPAQRKANGCEDEKPTEKPEAPKEKPAPPVAKPTPVKEKDLPRHDVEGADQKQVNVLFVVDTSKAFAPRLKTFADNINRLVNVFPKDMKVNIGVMPANARALTGEVVSVISTKSPAAVQTSAQLAQVFAKLPTDVAALGVNGQAFFLSLNNAFTNPTKLAALRQKGFLTGQPNMIIFVSAKSRDICTAQKNYVVADCANFHLDQFTTLLSLSNNNTAPVTAAFVAADRSGYEKPFFATKTSAASKALNHHNTVIDIDFKHMDGGKLYIPAHSLDVVAEMMLTWMKETKYLR